MTHKGYDPTIEVNDILHESVLRKVEFDKVCFGAKYQVFARNTPHEPWRHVAEAMTEEEAIEISKDDDRCFGAELQTEIDRRRARAIRELTDAEGITKPAALPADLQLASSSVLDSRLPEGAGPAGGVALPDLNEQSLEALAKQLKELQAEGIPITLKTTKVTFKKPKGR